MFQEFVCHSALATNPKTPLTHENQLKWKPSTSWWFQPTSKNIRQNGWQIPQVLGWEIPKKWFETNHPDIKIQKSSGRRCFPAVVGSKFLSRMTFLAPLDLTLYSTPGHCWVIRFNKSMYLAEKNKTTRLCGFFCVLFCTRILGFPWPRCLEKVKHISPNGGFIVIYHGTK